jgi:hypothetical protein
MEIKPFKYNPPRATVGDLRTPIVFFEYQPTPGPEPGEIEKTILFQAWAKIDHVWLKDLEQAKANKTLSDVTIVIRNPREDYFPTLNHFFSIEAPGYESRRYNVEHIQTDFPIAQFITIVGRLESWE